jgi:hypothetical protein
MTEANQLKKLPEPFVQDLYVATFEIGRVHLENRHASERGYPSPERPAT